MDFCTVLLVSLLASFSSSTNANAVNVVNIGAAGNGKTDDSNAFMKAWHRVCGASQFSTLLIPPEKTFLLRHVTFQGPCRSPRVHVKVQGNIVAPGDTSTSLGGKTNSWITFIDVHGITVDGGGQIDGRGANWWKWCVKQSQICQSRPFALAFFSCSGLQLRGLKLVDSPGKFVSIYNSYHATISNLHILAPGNSPNTDGIAISHSKKVLVHDTVIGTGDDCIAIISDSSSINIKRVTCGPGHGISIGSIGEDGSQGYVENVRVSDSTFIGSTNGARIKTWQGGKGYVRNIAYQGIKLVGTSNPIKIDQFYCNSHNCANQTSAVAISDVSFTQFHGTCSSQYAVDLCCNQVTGCTKILMDHIHIGAAGAAYKANGVRIFNAHGRASDTYPKVALLH